VIDVWHRTLEAKRIGLLRKSGLRGTDRACECDNAVWLDDLSDTFVGTAMEVNTLRGAAPPEGSRNSYIPWSSGRILPVESFGQFRRIIFAGADVDGKSANSRQRMIKMPVCLDYLSLDGGRFVRERELTRYRDTSAPVDDSRDSGLKSRIVPMQRLLTSGEGLVTLGAPLR
jgi:hypothetical protein